MWRNPQFPADLCSASVISNHSLKQFLLSVKVKNSCGENKVKVTVMTNRKPFKDYGSIFAL